MRAKGICCVCFSYHNLFSEVPSAALPAKVKKKKKQLDKFQKKLDKMEDLTEQLENFRGLLHQQDALESLARNDFALVDLVRAQKTPEDTLSTRKSAYRHPHTPKDTENFAPVDLVRAFQSTLRSTWNRGTQILGTPLGHLR